MDPMGTRWDFPGFLMGEKNTSLFLYIRMGIIWER